MMGFPFDPGAPWRGFDPSTFDVDVPEFEFPTGERESSIAACYASVPVETACEIERVAQLAHAGLHDAAQRVRQAVGYAGFGGDRLRESRDNDPED